MKLIGLLLAVFVVCVVTASAEKREFLERGTPISLPAGWKRVSKEPLLESERILELVFALKQRNTRRLEEIFWEVSDPRNAHYGKHLSLEQLGHLLSPSQENVDAVVEFLKQNGVKKVQVNPIRDFLKANVSIAVAQRLFNVEFHSFVRVSDGLVFETSVGPYSLPESIAKHVDLVTGVVGFLEERKPRVQRPNKNRAEAASKDITPTVVRTRYNVSSSLVCTNANNSHAVAEFQAQYYSPTDLKTFWTKYVDYATYEAVAKVIGTNNEKNPSLEASLDVQYLMSVAPNATTWFYSQAKTNFWDDLVAWTSVLSSETSIPWIHSVSYGSQGDYPSDSYRDRLNTEFQKIGVRGASVIFASGDYGSGCGGDGGSQACQCTFYPSFPATCPYVTSIGATRFIDGNSGPEAAVFQFKSGGGFSQYFTTQDYQEAGVNQYFNSSVQLPPSCAYNREGRGTPDAAALGDVYFEVVVGGSVTQVGGTSASAPSFSGIMTLVNDARLNAGKPTLGFLNPWIYQAAANYSDAFYDITVGNNEISGCCTSGNAGFICTVGWDPVCGVGTPNFAVLSTL